MHGGEAEMQTGCPPRKGVMNEGRHKQSLFAFSCANMYMAVCVHICAHIHAHTHAYGGHRLMLDIFLDQLFYFTEQGFPLNL